MRQRQARDRRRRERRSPGPPGRRGDRTAERHQRDQTAEGELPRARAGQEEGDVRLLRRRRTESQNDTTSSTPRATPTADAAGRCAALATGRRPRRGGWARPRRTAPPATATSSAGRARESCGGEVVDLQDGEDPVQEVGARPEIWARLLRHSTGGRKSISTAKRGSEHQQRGGQQTPETARVEGEEVDPSGGLELAREQAGDQESRDDEEHVDADVSTRHPLRPQVVQQDRRDRQGAQRLDVGPEARSAPAGLLIPRPGVLRPRRARAGRRGPGPVPRRPRSRPRPRRGPGGAGPGSRRPGSGACRCAAGPWARRRSAGPGRTTRLPRRTGWTLSSRRRVAVWPPPMTMTS